MCAVARREGGSGFPRHGVPDGRHQSEGDDMDKIKVIHDALENTLTVWLDDPGEGARLRGDDGRGCPHEGLRRPCHRFRALALPSFRCHGGFVGGDRCEGAAVGTICSLGRLGTLIEPDRVRQELAEL